MSSGCTNGAASAKGNPDWSAWCLLLQVREHSGGVSSDRGRAATQAHRQAGEGEQLCVPDHAQHSVPPVAG